MVSMQVDAYARESNPRPATGGGRTDNTVQYRVRGRVGNNARAAVVAPRNADPVKGGQPLESAIEP